jgi:hypothetical protein
MQTIKLIGVSSQPDFFECIWDTLTDEPTMIISPTHLLKKKTTPMKLQGQQVNPSVFGNVEDVLYKSVSWGLNPRIFKDLRVF